jgi:hypothetical protein
MPLNLIQGYLRHAMAYNVVQEKHAKVSNVAQVENAGEINVVRQYAMGDNALA